MAYPSWCLERRFPRFRDDADELRRKFPAAAQDAFLQNVVGKKLLTAGRGKSKITDGRIACGRGFQRQPQSLPTRVDWFFASARPLGERVGKSG